MWQQELFDFWFPPKQGLKHSQWSWPNQKSPIWFLISTKTRIETKLINFCLFFFFRIWFLISTKTRIETIGKLLETEKERQFDFWFPPKQGLKQKKTKILKVREILFDFWFPPKQGLKLYHFFSYFNSYLFIWFLISTKTRIETRIGINRKITLKPIWFLISTKTRIETNCKIHVKMNKLKFDFWFPPKQGLKH